MKAAVWGVGPVGGFGCGVGDLASALKRGASPVETVRINTFEETVDVPALLADTRSLADRVDRRFLRRTEHFTKIALLSCLLAIEDGERHGAPEGGRRGIILGTGYGSTCNAFDLKGVVPESELRGFSPIFFSNSVHNAAIANIATVLKENGPGLAINHFDMSVPLALMTACQWLDAGRVDSVLVGGADEFSKIMALHRHRLLAENTPEAVDPIMVGEGGAFFLLTRPTETPPPYGYIESATTGTNGRAVPRPDPDAIYFINADGFNPEADRHVRHIGKSAAVAAYRPLYGQFPAGTALDVAIGAMALKSGMIPPSLRKTAAAGEVRAPQSVGGRCIHCETIGSTGEKGEILLRRDPD